MLIAITEHHVAGYQPDHNIVNFIAIKTTSDHIPEEPMFTLMTLIDINQIIRNDIFQIKKIKWKGL